MVPRKTNVGLRKFWPDLEISEAFWMGLKVSESRICRFFFPFGLQGSNFSEFVATAYQTKLLNQNRKA